MIPVCSDNCDFDLGPINQNPCAPKVSASQLRRLFVGKPAAAAFNDWKSPDEWLERIDQVSTTGDDYIRVLSVTGDKPAPTSTPKVIENGMRVSTGKEHVINFTTYQVTDENYAFMRNTECNILVRLFGYETMGGKMFATNEGQLVYITLDDVLAGGDDDLEALIGALSWKTKFSFERAESPIFDTDFNGGVGGVTPTFDTVQTFAAAVEATSGGITTTVPAIDIDLKFEFNLIITPVGGPANMVLKKVGSEVASVDYPTDYNGAAWRFTDAAGIVHTGVFTAGDVLLT